MSYYYHVKYYLLFCLELDPSEFHLFLFFSMAPAARLAMTRRVHPLVSLNPYQGNWTIKVRLTNKGTMRTYKNARGEGCVFNVELTDEDVSIRGIPFSGIIICLSGNFCDLFVFVSYVFYVIYCLVK